MGGWRGIWGFRVGRRGGDRRRWAPIVAAAVRWKLPDWPRHLWSGGGPAASLFLVMDFEAARWKIACIRHRFDLSRSHDPSHIF